MNRWCRRATVLLVLMVCSCGSTPAHSSLRTAASPTADTSTWWQINLSDSEVFYGHIRGTTTSDIDLVNVYYVQGSARTVLGLVSNQIQCPTDEVVINRDVVTAKTTIPASSQLASKLDTLVLQPARCFQPSS